MLSQCYEILTYIKKIEKKILNLIWYGITIWWMGENNQSDYFVNGKNIFECMFDNT